MLKLFAPIMGYLRGEAEAFAERAKWMSVFRTATGVAFLGAAAFGLIALHLWLATLVTPVQSALIISCAFLVAAIIIMLIAQYWNNLQEKREAERRREARSDLVSASLSAGMVALARTRNLKDLAVPAALAGAIVYLMTKDDDD